MLKNLRILLVSYSGRFAGMEHRMIDEAKFLQKHGAVVEVATRDFAESYLFENALEELQIPLRRLSPPPFLSNWRLRHYYYTQFQFARLRYGWMRKYDLARVFMPWSNRGLEQMYLAAILGVPVIVSAHSAWAGMPTKTGWHDYFFQKLFQKVYGFFGISASAFRGSSATFDGYLRRDTVQRIIPNCIDTEDFFPCPEFKNRLKKQLGIHTETKLLAVSAVCRQSSAHKLWFGCSAH